MKKLLLVDGSNQAFRAFHGMRTDMRAPDGSPTRALFGFAMVLQKLLRDQRPDYVAVVFDKGLSFRNELYPDYKGQRPDMPEELRVQWPELAPFAEELGMTTITIDGVEADDIIGTLAVRYAGPDLHAVIVSSDKDFCQLVNEHVRIYDVGKDEEFGREGVLARWGVPPERMLELLALMGDTSDNVPGVPGVGPKKAAQYLEKYGDAAGVIAHAAEIGGKTGQSIADNAGNVDLARKLVTIVTDLELGLGLEDLVVRQPHWEMLEQRLLRYNFRRMLEEVRGQLGDTATAREGLDRSGYRGVVDVAGLRQLVAGLRQAGRFAYDSETTSLDPLKAELVGMSFCWGPDDAVYVPIAHRDPETGELAAGNCPGALDALVPLLADPSLRKTGQNLKYDLEVLRARGYDLAGIDGDTMLADYLLDVDRKHGLDEMALRLLDHKMISFKDLTASTGGKFESVGIADAVQYAAEDAHVAWLLDGKLGAGIDEARLGAVYREIELPLIDVLADMELEGIGIDLEALGALSVELGGRIDEVVREVHSEAGQEFNVNSTQQLATILFDERGLDPVKKTKTGRSTDAQTLERLAAQGDRLSGLVLQYRELAKLKSTYVDALPQHAGVDGRIHTSFHQAVAATGRLSSNDPNLQNIPIRTPEGRRIRDCFVARPGHLFLSADYSQIELRVLAHFCAEGRLVEAYRSGEDIHRRTAAEVFGVNALLVSPDQRRVAKAINFGIVYGMSAFRLSNDLGIPRRVAQDYIDGYFARYPQVRGYMEGAVQQARDRGFAETLFGRRRTVPRLDATNPVERGAAERVAINTPVQGTAADLIKRAMLLVHQRLKAEFPHARLLLQVHDELVLEVPDDDVEAVRAAVVAEMERAADLVVPLVADTGTGRTWGAAH